MGELMEREREPVNPQVRACGAADPEADDRLMLSLPEGHVLRVLMEEHNLIRATLDRLDELAASLLAGDPCEEHLILTEMRTIGAKLVASEPHHQREERVLFPRLYERGLVGPPMVMNEEHIEIRLLKHRIEDEAHAAIIGFGRDLPGLAEAARLLTAILRAHIIKENGILYPMALGLIREDEVWAEMREESEAIGPCFATPDWV